MLGRLARLKALLLLSSVFALAQGCAAEQGEDDNATDPEVGTDAITTSRSNDRLLDTPFYFSVPKSSVDVPLNRQAYPYPTLWNPSPEIAAL